jgi:hypothetical protein
MAAMGTSVMHHEYIKNSQGSIQVKQVEQSIALKMRDIEKYVDFFLGEFDDSIHSCRRRELVIRVKPEYADQIGLSLRHTLLDKDLVESMDSRRVRSERSLFLETC